MEKINAVILCGGMATRLGNLTKDKPKILVECDGKPFIDYLLNNLNWCINKGREEDAFDCERVTFAAGTSKNQHAIGDYIAKMPRDILFKTSRRLMCDSHNVGDIRRGTAGSLKHCRPDNNYKTLVINGDSYISKKMLYEFIKYSIISKRHTMLLGMPMSFDNHEYDYISFNKRGVVDKYYKTIYSSPTTNIASTGYYIFNSSVFSIIPDDVTYSLEDDVLPQLVESKKLGVFPIGYIEKLFDMGTPNGLAKFEDYLKYKKLVGEEL